MYVAYMCVCYPSYPPSLYNHVLSAVEESLGRAGIAVLCLLYCSRCGLTEVELLEMLGTLEESNEQGNQIGLLLCGCEG